MHIVLVEPEIPQNTGNIARLSAATNSTLHLVGKLGFSLEDRYLKRAGLDYWPSVDLHVHAHLEDLLCLNQKERFPDAAPSPLENRRFFCFSARRGRPYSEVAFHLDDYLIFGKETKGLDPDLLPADSPHWLTLPITDKVRSLNLANAVSIVVYEALRQNSFSGLAV